MESLSESIKVLAFYTIGQRKGVGISNKKPVYVVKIIPEKNIIVLGEEKDLLQIVLK